MCLGLFFFFFKLLWLCLCENILKGRGENDTFQGKYEHGETEMSCLWDKVIVGEIHKAEYIFKKESSQTYW